MNSKKINSFTISNKTLEIMKLQIDIDYIMRKRVLEPGENGFILCAKSDSDILSDEGHYQGDAKFRDQNCKVGTKVGLFHTQHRIDISLEDLSRAYSSWVACIGTLNLGGRLTYLAKCYIRKSDKIDPNIMDELNNKAEEYNNIIEVLKRHRTFESNQKIDEIKENARRESDHIAYNFFDVIDVLNERKPKKEKRERIIPKYIQRYNERHNINK